MAARAIKHDHDMAVISHYDDWSAVLMMCQIRPCYSTKTLKPGKVKMNDGPTGSIRARYRPETAQEWEDRIKELPHLCCQEK